MLPSSALHSIISSSSPPLPLFLSSLFSLISYLFSILSSLFPSPTVQQTSSLRATSNAWWDALHWFYFTVSVCFIFFADVQCISDHPQARERRVGLLKHAHQPPAQGCVWCVVRCAAMRHAAMRSSCCSASPSWGITNLSFSLPSITSITLILFLFSLNTSLSQQHRVFTCS